VRISNKWQIETKFRKHNTKSTFRHGNGPSVLGTTQQRLDAVRQNVETPREFINVKEYRYRPKRKFAGSKYGGCK
jgi:hypothetical protein